MWRLGLLAVPLAEIAAFILVGGWIGLGPTLLLVVLAALAGALLLRRQGGATAGEVARALRGGGDPTAALVRGGFRLVAGVLLIVPGFLGDLLALLLLVPAVQRRALSRLSRRGRGLARTVVRPGVIHPAGPFGTPPPPTSAEPVVEAEWAEVSPPKRPARPPSGWTRS